MTEADLQNAIYLYAVDHRHTHLCPNVCCYEWEADFLSVTQSGYVHEYECKVTFSDFRADAKKVSKHQTLEHGGARPNYFWYVCPEGLIPRELLPPYAGLLYAQQDGWRRGETGVELRKLRIVQPAQLLHKEKYSPQIAAHLATSISAKYWNLRLAQQV